LPLVPYYKFADLPDVLSIKTAAPLEPNRFEPELRLAFVMLNVYVRRLVTVARVEEKPIWPDL
jgi:hypothetical protein